MTNLANLPPSERPKAKPSRKIVNNQQNIAAAAANAGGSNGADKSKKCQLQVCQFLDLSRSENLKNQFFGGLLRTFFVTK